MLIRAVIVRVLDDSFADFESQIQAAEGGIALLEIFHDAQSMKIVIEEQTVLAHGGVERFFSGVAKRRMADVMNQGERLSEIGVEVERSGDGARDLRDFKAVSEAV